jgi:hypothetical protein
MANTTNLTGSSKQYIGVVDMLCEGPIYGLEKGMNDVYINDVPFENATLVGSLTDSGSALSLTLTPTSSTAMTVTNGTIQETDVGKIAHIEVETSSVSSITQAASGSYVPVTVTTITPSTTLNSNWQNYELDKYYTIVRNTVTGRKYGGYSYWNSSTNTITMYSLPIRRGFGSAANWELVLFQAAKIATYVSDTSFTLVDALHNYSNLTNANFTVSASITTTPDNPDPNASTSKVEGSTLQFRQGLLEQSPISQVHGVSGGVTKTGNTTVVSLKQFSNSTELNNYKSGSPYSGISTFGYPTGQSYVQNSGAQQLFNSSAFGASAPSQVNEINVRINYNSLILYNTENGDKEDAYAIYVFEVRTKINNTWSPFRKLFSQYGTFIVHRGRTTAPVSFDHTIGLDRFKPFDDFELRLTRLTRDAGLPVRADGSNGGETDVDKWNLQATASTGGANLSSTIQDSFIYPHTAIAAISFSSKTYNQLPSRSYLLKGLMVEIPTAYTPREYSSTGVAEYDSWWDGTFKTELYYTDNPAWVFYDIVTNARYGAGNWLEEYNIDKFALYRIAKYCDELVDDGNGGTEPRFRANIYLAKATDVYKVLKDFASLFTGMLYWLDGKLSPIQDVPGEPVYTFSKANVIDGKFNYESTGRKTRSNQVVVTWNDPTRNYEPVNLIVEDREDIVAQRKIISQKAVAFGATSEGQAIRYGRWKLWTAQNQKEVVSFQTGLQGAYIRPGDIINVQDRDRYGIDFSGKIVDITVDNRLLLDRAITNITDSDGLAITYELSTLVTSYAAFYAGLNPLTLDGKTYQRGDRITARVYLDTDGDGVGTTLALGTVNSEEKASNAFADSSGTPLPLDWKPYSYVVTKDVTLNTSDGITAVSMASGESWYSSAELPAEGTIFALVAKNSNDVGILGSSKQYRVLGISFEDSKNIYGISAVEHYNSKYDAVDKDYALGVIPDNTYADIEDPDANVPAPGNIYVVSETDSSKPGDELRIEWDIPQETYTDGNGDTREREYQFLDSYEIYHTVPDLDNPLFTTKNSYRFEGLADGIYIFRVRTRSNKGNYSDYVSVTYDVNDPFGTNVRRVVGGLPKGIIANSTAYNVHNSEIVDEEDRYKLIWKRDTAARGFSIANSMFGGTTGIATNLQSVGLFGLAVSGPLVYVANNAGTSTDRPDGWTGDSEWHYLHYDGSTSLSYWNTRTLDNVPFYHKINTNGFGWRGSEQSWTTLFGGGYTAASVAAGSNRLVATANGDFLSDLRIRDIVHFDGKAQSFEMYKVEQLSDYNSEGVVSVRLREWENVGVATDPDWLDGDIVTFERVSGATNVNGQYYYVKQTGSVERYQLYHDAALTDPLITSELGGTYTLLTGFVTRAKVKAAKVIAVIDDSTAILDRSFSEAISVSRLYKLNYRPDYNDDAVFGRVKWNGYNNTDDVHTFIVDSFIEVNEGLNVGALDVLVRPDVGSILYSENGTTQETQFTSPLTVTLIASGFNNPQFRIIKVEGAGSALDFDMEDDNLDIPFVGNNGALDYTEDLFTATEANAISWEDGVEIKITAEVRESNNTGVNTTGEGYILKTSSGATGIDGKTVELRAEDYSIIYDEAGANPIIGGNGDRVLTFTATARNYDDPQFKFIFNGQNLSDTTAFTLAGDPGYDNTTPGATYVWGTTKEVDVEDGIVATATVTVPTTYEGNWGDNKNQKTFLVTVEAREGSTGPFTSTDEVTIIGVHALKGGYWVAMSNASGNSIPTDFDGEVVGTADANGFVTVLDTGTTIEVGKGAEILELTNLSTATWDAAAPSSKLGYYNISTNVVPSSSALQVGAQTGGDENSDYIVTYADHKFSKTGWTQETAGIQYIIDIEDTGSDNAIRITQPFTKSKQGFGGARLVLSNPSQEVSSNASLIPQSFAGTSTTVNCFLTGFNLPYYASGATIPSNVNAFWRLKTINPTNVTADSNPTYPSNGSTAAVSFGNITAFPKTASKGSIEFTAGLFIRGGDGGFVEEELEVTQQFTKNTSGAYVSIFATPSHYVYDQDTTTQSPATNHTFSLRGFIGDEATWKYEITGGALSSPLTGTAGGSGSRVVTAISVPNTSNLPYYDSNNDVNEYTYTVKLYDSQDTNNDTVLAEDAVTISLSRSTPDSLVIDLTNDYDAVVVPRLAQGEGSSELAVTVSTTANIYKDGVLEDPDDWNFSVSQSTTLIGGTTSTSTATLAFDSTNTNQLNITNLGSDQFLRSAITISATHKTNAAYATQNAIFVLQRLFGGVQLKIIPSVDVVTYDPDSDTYGPSTGTVTFAVNRITENGEEASVTNYYYELDGGTRTLASTTAPSKDFTSSAPDPVVADSTTLKVFTDSTSTTVMDTSTVPLMLQGVQGIDGVALSLTAEPVSFDYDGSAYDPTSTSTISLNVNGATATGASWTLNNSNAGLNSSIGIGDKTLTFINNLTEAAAKASVTVSVTVTGTTSDGTTGVNLGTATVKVPTTIQGSVGVDGNPGPRSVFAYIYYQSSSTSAPTIPALSTFTPNFTDGSVASSDGNWSTNSPTFVAGNTNKYWYFTFTATESGTYNNGYPSVTKNSSPSAGSGAIQGIGFTGLVTFSSTNNIDGFNPIEWINDNGATTGTSNTTTIDGGLIRTNTIIASKLNFTPVTSVAGVTGSSISTAQLSSAGLSLTQDLGSLASQNTVDLVNDISGNLPTTSGGTGNSYSNLTALANGIAATTAFGDLASLDSISATSSYITGLGDLATQNEANLDFIGLSSTVVQAGKITLGTSGVLFDNADSSHTVVENAIILDTSGSANAIYIYDGSVLRVKLGKL